MIEAYSRRGTKPTQIEVVEHTMFYGGGVTPKEQIQGRVSGREVSLIERPFDVNIFRNWYILKAAGFPVVGTMRLTESGTLLMTDVKADDSELYGRGLYQLLGGVNSALTNPIYRNEKRRYPAPGVDAQFIDLVDNHLPEIGSEVSKLVRLANDSGLTLPSDDPLELQVHPDQSWNLIVLDVADVEYGIPELREMNAWSKINFLEDLQGLRDKLKA